MPEEAKIINKKYNLVFPIILSLITFVVFFNSLAGEFVYDDNRQILLNPLIQDSSLYGKALISDVWAFKGDGTLSASNYWRPSFTAFHILNFLLFGLNPFGWHLANLLLHISVCLLAYLLLRRWNLSEITAFSISLIFAVHPVHVESVAWISGSPDLLLSLFLLTSFWFTENFVEKNNRLDLVLALIFYALALGSKEVAIFCFPIYFLIFAKDKLFEIGEIKANLLKLIPFGLVTILYFILRAVILNGISKPVEDAPTFSSAIISIPTVFIFYVKQIIFPLTLSINYSLRPVSIFGIFEFIFPFIVSIAIILLFLMLAKRTFVQKLGLAIFLFPLLPTFNILSFPFEQIVHDRYLYLPLLGFLMIFIPYFAEFGNNKLGKSSAKIGFSLVVLISVLLSFQTFFYNRVWLDEVSLWQNAVKVDANSAFNWSQFGAILSEKEKPNEATEAYNNALDIRPLPSAYLGRAQSFIKTNKFEEAIWDLQTITEMPADKLNAYTLYQSYEAYSLALEKKQNFVKAEAVLREGRKRLPIYFAALTEKIAIILYQQSRKQEALKELESAKSQAIAEFLPSSKAVFLRLGMLQTEFGQKEQAKKNLQEYLRLTNAMQDKFTQGDRKQALEILKSL